MQRFAGPLHRFLIASLDCNTNSIPDECEADFDGDGITDDCDPDIDGDGVLNDADLCDQTPLGTEVRCDGTYLADADIDCDVDLDDYAWLQAQFTGPGAP